MKKKEHLPLMGVGPIYVFVIIGCTVAAILLADIQMLKTGRVEALKVPFLILGIMLIILGNYFWISANFQSKLDANIKSNTLITTGVYAYVRNPVYSAFVMMCTGALLMANNCWLLILPIFYLVFMTVLMKNTEEKWLYNLYGEQYKEYCKRVNRCIPWKKVLK